MVYQLILPETLRNMVLEQLHNQPSQGDLGIRRTLARVLSRFYWVRCRVRSWLGARLVKCVKDTSLPPKGIEVP